MRRIIASAPRVSLVTRRLLCSDAAVPPSHVVSAQTTKTGHPGPQGHQGIGATPVIWAVSSNLDASQKSTAASVAVGIPPVDALADQSASDSPLGPTSVASERLSDRDDQDGSVSLKLEGFPASLEKDLSGLDDSVAALSLDPNEPVTALAGDDLSSKIESSEGNDHVPLRGNQNRALASAEDICEEIRVLSRRNAYRPAGHLFSNALKRGDPELVTFQVIRSALPILAKLMWAKTISETLSFMTKYNIEAPTPVFNCAFAGLFRDNRAAEIASTIERMWTLPGYSQPNASSYTYLISAYFCQGNEDKAFGVLQDMKNRMVYPSLGTYQTLIAGCIKMGAARRAFETLMAVEQQRFEMSALIVGHVMVACAEVDDLEAVAALLSRFDDALGQYSADIEGRTARRRVQGRAGTALERSGERRIAGGEPSLEMAGLMSLLHAAYRGARPDIAGRALSLYLEWYPDCPAPASAWYCVIGAHSFAGDFSAAFDTLSRMRAAGYRPTLTELQESLVKPLSADLEKVDEQFYRLADFFAAPTQVGADLDASSAGNSTTLDGTGCSTSVAVSESESSVTTEIRPDAASGPADEAESCEVSKKVAGSLSLGEVMLSPPSGTFGTVDKSGVFLASERLEVGIEEMNCIIAACSQAGDLERAFQTYDEAQRCGLRPNVETFNALLSGCVVTRHFKGGLRIIEEMNESDVELNHETVHLLTRLFMRIGYFDKALAVVEDAARKGIELSTSTYQTLARKLMRMGHLGDVRKLIALAERNGITTEAVVARVEVHFYRDLEALDGDVEVLEREPRAGPPNRGGNQKRGTEAYAGSQGRERGNESRESGSEEWGAEDRGTLVQKEAV